MKLRFQYIGIILFISINQFARCHSIDDSDRDFSQDRVAMIDRCIRLAGTIISSGYTYFTKDKASYDLQIDVLNVPYKNMIYLQTQEIEKLFDDANKHDNPLVQIRSLILLYRVSVSEWYLKSFSKGLDILYQICFDEQGNFIDASALGDIRLVFKDYCQKMPKSWQEIAKIPGWRYKNKKPYSIYTQHYADTCTENNIDLLSMIEANRLQDLVYLKYLLMKNGSKAARKIYDYQIDSFLKIDVTELHKKSF